MVIKFCVIGSALICAPLGKVMFGHVHSVAIVGKWSWGHKEWYGICDVSKLKYALLLLPRVVTVQLQLTILFDSFKCFNNWQCCHLLILFTFIIYSKIYTLESAFKCSKYLPFIWNARNPPQIFSSPANSLLAVKWYVMYIIMTPELKVLWLQGSMFLAVWDDTLKVDSFSKSSCLIGWMDYKVIIGRITPCSDNQI